jgi:uncharacterized protein (TIGR00369 family)
MTPNSAQKLLNENFAPWVLALDLTVTEVDSAHVMIRMPLGEHLARHGGIVSGQALASLADTAMSIAAIGQFDTFTPVATTDLHTQFLRAGVGTAILCRAEIVRAGRAMVFARAEMTEETSGKAVAVATASFYVP